MTTVQRVARARAVNVHPPTVRPPTAAPAPERQRSIARELHRYLPRLVAGSLAVAGTEVLAGVAMNEPALLGAALLTTGFALVLLAVGRLIGGSREHWVAPILAGGVYALGLLGAILIPGAATASALLPILSVVLLLPGRGRRGTAGLVALAVLGSLLCLLMDDAPHVFPPLDEPLGTVFAVATLLGVMLLILGALTDFASQARQSIEGMRTVLAARDTAFAERTAIVASLARLQRRETVEATAAVIVEELIRLPDIDLAAVFAVDGRDLPILALRGPASFPIGAGDILPAARARHLLDRSVDGPWAERWVDDATYGPYGAAFTATGITGQAYAPFFDGGRLIGIVAIGTLSRAHAEHLVAELPAVAEFAASASILLTPLLVARHELAAARETIGSIISAGTYRPVYQPVVELATGRTVGFEALTRFADGRRPDLVFGAATKAGLGLELELCTLAAAVEGARVLPADAWLSLNVSPSVVVEASGLAGVVAARDRPIVIEITEHVAIDDYRAVRSAIDRLGAGFRVAVDDAGAGIANFSHLVELRPQLVKVDAGLVRDLDTDLARQAAVVGFVHFAAKAGCEVIAEGIETEAERLTALDLGVTHGQGFLIARPAPAATFSAPPTTGIVCQAASSGALRWEAPVMPTGSWFAGIAGPTAPLADA